MPREQATVAEEEYLERIYWLEEAGLPVTAANVARAMQLSPPTVHEMVGRLEADGYISRADDKSLTFTESGREHATHVDCDFCDRTTKRPSSVAVDTLMPGSRALPAIYR